MTYVLGASLAVCAMTGCSQADDPQSRAAMLSVDDILGRCARVYQQAETVQARGLLQRDRGRSPIEWDYASPNRFRLQIGMNMALVDEEDWWSYDGVTDRFRSHRRDADAPIEAAASWLSGGLSFVLPAVLGKDSKVFSARDGWRLDGLEWLAQRPCYVASRGRRNQDRDGRLRVWVDQDTFLIRRWAWEEDSAEDTGKTIWACTYYDVALNEPMSPDRFQVRRPNPIALTGGPPGPGSAESIRHAMIEPSGRL